MNFEYKFSIFFEYRSQSCLISYSNYHFYSHLVIFLVFVRIQLFVFFVFTRRRLDTKLSSLVRSSKRISRVRGTLNRSKTLVLVVVLFFNSWESLHPVIFSFIVKNLSREVCTVFRFFFYKCPLFHPNPVLLFKELIRHPAIK